MYVFSSWFAVRSATLWTHYLRFCLPSTPLILSVKHSWCYFAMSSTHFDQLSTYSDGFSVSAFLNVMPLQNLMPVRFIPVRVHCSRCSGSRFSFGYERLITTSYTLGMIARSQYKFSLVPDWKLNLYHLKRVWMGLTDNWQMAKILTDNWQIA